MVYPIDKKLVVAVTSRAVFDMQEANEVFDAHGSETYREYQEEHLDECLAPGVAFPFIRRLLRLNELYPDQQPVEVVVLSRSDPASGRRFFRSCASHGLAISRGAFLSGKSPFPYIGSFNASIFLSANESDVLGAIRAGLPAGLVLPTGAVDDAADHELRIAFDFDGVLADDESESVYRESKDLESFARYEVEKATEPHKAGPLKDLFTKIGFFQKLEAKREREEPGYVPAVRIAIVTARNAPANERVVTTLEEWGMSATETFFLGGIEKKRVLDVLKPHIFFDDQLTHLEPAAKTIPSVFVPFGVVNSNLLNNLPPGGELVAQLKA
ncbi:MAG: 5'-nucleotidase [Rhodocyclaceae bacterium]|nr:5'-nucleotidase [Rhodocyclaceae bacterium]